MRKITFFIVVSFVFASCVSPPLRSKNKAQTGRESADQKDEKIEEKPKETASQSDEDGISAPIPIAGSHDETTPGFFDFEKAPEDVYLFDADACKKKPACGTDWAGNLSIEFREACIGQGFRVLKIGCCGAEACSKLPVRQEF